MAEVDDPVGQAAEELLTCVQTTLETASPGASAMRYDIRHGTVATWDSCCEQVEGDGQAWIRVGRVFPTTGGLAQDRTLTECPPALAAEMDVGAVRCIGTVQDGGTPPSGITDDALKTTRDIALLLRAAVCCYTGLLRPDQWTPLGPQGGCAGGVWQVTAAVDCFGC